MPTIYPSDGDVADDLDGIATDYSAIINDDADAALAAWIDDELANGCCPRRLARTLIAHGTRLAKTG